MYRTYLPLRVFVVTLLVPHPLLKDREDLNQSIIEANTRLGMAKSNWLIIKDLETGEIVWERTL